MESLGPKGYQETALRVFTSTFDTRGKRILEVGGSNLPRDYLFDTVQPSQWVSVDPIPETTLARMRTGEAEPYLDHLRAVGLSSFEQAASEPDRPYTIIAAPIEHAGTTLIGRFDLVFSVACFEHVHKLDSALTVIHGALRENGALWSQYSPIWSCIDGHHCGWITEHRKAEFVGTAQGLIPPFGHLLYREDEMRSHLGPFYEPEQLDMAIHAIYRTDYINRLFFDDYVRIATESPFEEVDLRGVWPASPTTQTAEQLSRLYPGRSGFEYQGIELCAHKRGR